ARERLPRLGELPFEAAGALERVGEDRLDRDAATERQLLAEHPDRSGDLEGPGSGDEGSGGEAQQGGLGAAVVTEQPGGAARGHDEAHVGQDAAVRGGAGEGVGDPLGPQVQGGIRRGGVRGHEEAPRREGTAGDGASHRRMPVTVTLAPRRGRGIYAADGWAVDARTLRASGPVGRETQPRTATAERIPAGSPSRYGSRGKSSSAARAASTSAPASRATSATRTLPPASSSTRAASSGATPVA